MIIKCNKILFDKNVQGLALYPFIFLRKDVADDPYVINHEKIHLRQQKEMLVIFFYIWYLIELVFKGYYQICFEQEAYKNDKNLMYLQNRDFWSFLKY